MLLFPCLLALTAVSVAAPTVRVRPPQLPAIAPIPAVDRLLHRQAAFLLAAIPAGPIAGELELSIRPLTGTAYTLAVCLRLKDCPSPDAARAAVLRLLRDLTRAHVSGGGATATGRPWGNHWQSAFWTYQAVFAAWLLWTDLPPDLQDAVIRMAVHEADRFLDLPAPHAEFLDTKAEENAWNSMILVWAGEALEGHPHRERWRRRGLEYMVTAFARRADRHSATPVDGRPLRQWVRGANIHDDFTLENHGFVHPDYMTTVSMNLTNAATSRLAGRPVPQTALHNVRGVYDLLKFFTLPDGALFYPNSTDWNLHQVAHTFNLHVLAGRLLRDPDSAALAAASLATLEKMQARRGDGRLWVPGEYTSYPSIEQHAAFLVASARLAAALWPEPPAATPIGQVWKKLEGVRLFDDARAFVVRTSAGVSSFGWGLRILGQTVPFSPDPILNPLNHSYLGLAGELPADGSKPGRLGIVSAELEAAIAGDAVSLNTVVPSLESGAASVTAWGRRGRISQAFSFTALPSGASVYMERYSGKGTVHSGMISLTEEPEWVHGTARRRIEQGPGWLNVDGRLGFVRAGCGGAVAERTDYRTRTLFLNDAPPGDSVCAIVTVPGADVARTRALAARPLRVETGDSAGAAVLLDGFLVVSNFSPHPTTFQVQSPGGPVAVQVNGISTRVAPRQP